MIVNISCCPIVSLIIDYFFGQCSQTEAVHGIHSLLVSLSGEEIIDTYSYCYRGLSLPMVSSFLPSKMDPSSSAESHEDQDTLKKDVVEGLLQMNLLPRLRYILEVCQPPIEVSTMILEILIVVARHSLNTANQVNEYNRNKGDSRAVAYMIRLICYTQVLNCARLVNFIREQFLCSVEVDGD